MKRSSVEWRYSEEQRLENGSRNKKQRCLYTDKPSLLHLCMRQAALHLPRHGQRLQFLPTDLSITLLHDFLRRSPAATFTELKILCENSWSLQNLSLCGVQRLNSRGIQQLSLLPNLVRLDFRGCQWLVNLNFLSGMFLAILYVVLDSFATVHRLGPSWISCFLSRCDIKFDSIRSNGLFLFKS